MLESESTPQQELALWLFSAIYAEQAGAVQLDEQFDRKLAGVRDHLKKLEGKGIGRKTLYFFLAYSQRIEKTADKKQKSDWIAKHRLSAAGFRNLARDLKHVLARMKGLSTNVAYPARDADKRFKWSRETSGGVCVSPLLEEQLVQKIEVYEHFGELCAKRQFPTMAQIRSIAAVWPVLYVDCILKQPRYAKIADLLDAVGVSRDDKALTAAYADLLTRNKPLCEWMRINAFMRHIDEIGKTAGEVRIRDGVQFFSYSKRQTKSMHYLGLGSPFCTNQPKS